jgi:hypothetical protein
MKSAILEDEEEEEEVKGEISDRTKGTTRGLKLSNLFL